MTEDLVGRALAGDPSGVARAISTVEDRRPERQSEILELLGALVRRGRGATSHRVGITGPPGVGKSTLVSALLGEERARGRTVGVLAVDPSSPRSGGALLGDRARMQTDATDDGVFIRSMASGGDLGGLAVAAGAAIEVLSAVYDVVIVETTGVGQSETDVEHVTDTVALVIQPGSGDILQFLKAGILEIPDIFVVNKADLGAIAERAVAELSSALGVGHSAGRVSNAKVLRTVASTGEGIAELCATLDDCRPSAGDVAARRAARGARWAAKCFAVRHGERGVERVGGKRALVTALEGFLASEGATMLEALARAEAGLGR